MPALSQLNPNDSYYVSQLDEGVRTLRDLITAELESLRALDEGFYRRTLQELRGIDGIDVRETPPVSKETKVGGEVVRSVSIEEILVSAHNVQASRQMEDTTRRLSREREDSLRAIDDTLIPLKREYQDFYTAIYALTDIKPLTRITRKIPLHQAFVPHKDSVYVVTLNTATLEVSLQLHPNLTRQQLEDKSFVTRFRQKAKQAGYGGNAYVATNPSSAAINSGWLTDYVGLQISREALLRADARKGRAALVNFAMDTAQRLFTRNIAPATYAQQTVSVR